MKKVLIFCTILSLILWQIGTSVKYFATRFIVIGQTLDNPLFSLVYAKNTGGAFSILSNYTWFLAAFGVLALVVIAIYVYKHVKFEDKAQIMCASLLAAGILGNLLERISSGFVVDYIHLNFINFPIFNFFDVYITSAVVLIVVSSILSKKNET